MLRAGRQLTRKKQRAEYYNCSSMSDVPCATPQEPFSSELGKSLPRNLANCLVSWCSQAQVSTSTRDLLAWEQTMQGTGE